ncbi:hypothetical protein LG943_00625 [Streptomonospora sp. S1-112]|uniref:Uncharacterized protein n=1 Tax=Streptomonospora mangrovi TaxID=2883123 RepID=A0A9X3NLT8_9ACTN|nr:hypothetical protein [Streptomonospora mangrovi]MDA0562850.1 hypothetical protein [Streptomonospora mangrovi]
MTEERRRDPKASTRPGEVGSPTEFDGARISPEKMSAARDAIALAKSADPAGRAAGEAAVAHLNDRHRQEQGVDRQNRRRGTTA